VQQCSSRVDFESPTSQFKRFVSVRVRTVIRISISIAVQIGRWISPARPDRRVRATRRGAREIVFENLHVDAAPGGSGGWFRAKSQGTGQSIILACCCPRAGPALSSPSSGSHPCSPAHVQRSLAFLAGERLGKVRRGAESAAGACACSGAPSACVGRAGGVRQSRA